MRRKFLIDYEFMAFVAYHFELVFIDFQLNLESYSPPTLTGAGYQQTILTIKGHF